MDNNKWLKEMLDKLDAKVDKIDQRLDRIEDRHTNNTSILNEHIFRTELNEESIALLRDEVKPVKEHVVMISGAMKLLGLISLIAGIVTSFVKILEFLS